MNKCEICGKAPSPYPNWIISRGKAMHVGCMASALEKYDEQRRFLLDRCIASGAFGPWSDQWNEDWRKLWEEHIPK